MTGKTGLTRGVLSRRAGCKAETIRYYERIGLFPEPPRTKGGHRVYTEDHMKRLVFIRRSRELGFSLEDIRAMMGFINGDDYTCVEVKTLANRHLQDIQGKIWDLRKLERTLTAMASQCEGGTVSKRPVIDDLYAETELGNSVSKH